MYRYCYKTSMANNPWVIWHGLFSRKIRNGSLFGRTWITIAHGQSIIASGYYQERSRSEKNHDHRYDCHLNLPPSAAHDARPDDTRLAGGKTAEGSDEHARVRTSVETSLQLLADSIYFVRPFGLFSCQTKHSKAARCPSEFTTIEPRRSPPGL